MLTAKERAMLSFLRQRADGIGLQRTFTIDEKETVRDLAGLGRVAFRAPAPIEAPVIRIWFILPAGRAALDIDSYVRTALGMPL